MSDKNDKEEKEEIPQKKVKKNKSKKEEKFPLIELMEQSNYKNTMILGALDYSNLLSDFKEDILNGTNNLKLSSQEFDEIIQKYQKRRV